MIWALFAISLVVLVLTAVLLLLQRRVLKQQRTLRSGACVVCGEKACFTATFEIYTYVRLVRSESTFTVPLCSTHIEQAGDHISREGIHCVES